MKKLTRLSVIILVVGVSLLVTTFYRGESQQGFGIMQMLGTPSEDFVFDTRYLLPPRTCQIQLNASSEVDMYVLDKEGIKLWEEKGTLNPLNSSTESTMHQVTLEINERGECSILLFSKFNATNMINAVVRFNGLEKDLLATSVVITAAGLITLAISVILKQFRLRQEYKLTAKCN